MVGVVLQICYSTGTYSACVGKEDTRTSDSGRRRRRPNSAPNLESPHSHRHTDGGHGSLSRIKVTRQRSERNSDGGGLRLLRASAPDPRGVGHPRSAVARPRVPHATSPPTLEMVAPICHFGFLPPHTSDRIIATYQIAYYELPLNYHIER